MVVVISVLHPENKDVYIGMLYTDYRHPAQPVNPSASCPTCLIPIRLAPIRSQETPIHPRNQTPNLQGYRSRLSKHLPLLLSTRGRLKRGEY